MKNYNYADDCIHLKACRRICKFHKINSRGCQTDYCTAYESKNISDLKKEILNECMDLSDDNELKSKIQQLFKEEE